MSHSCVTKLGFRYSMQGLKKSDHVEFLDVILSGRSLEIVLQMTLWCVIRVCLENGRMVSIHHAWA